MCRRRWSTLPLTLTKRDTGSATKEKPVLEPCQTTHDRSPDRESRALSLVDSVIASVSKGFPLITLSSSQSPFSFLGVAGFQLWDPHFRHVYWEACQVRAVPTFFILLYSTRSINSSSCSCCSLCVFRAASIFSSYAKNWTLQENRLSITSRCYKRLWVHLENP